MVPQGSSPHIADPGTPIASTTVPRRMPGQFEGAGAAGAGSRGDHMIIWRGWGGLAIVYIGACAALLGGLLGASILQSSTAAGPLAGLGILIGGAITAVHGWYLNVLLPRKRAEQWEAAERPRLEDAADRGVLVVGNTLPSSPEEAAQMIESVIADGRRAIGRHGPHSVFWIPMEVIGILAMVGGIVLAGATLAAAFTG